MQKGQIKSCKSLSHHLTGEIHPLYDTLLKEKRYHKFENLPMMGKITRWIRNPFTLAKLGLINSEVE